MDLEQHLKTMNDHDRKTLSQFAAALAFSNSRDVTVELLRIQAENGDAFASRVLSENAALELGDIDTSKFRLLENPDEVRITLPRLAGSQDAAQELMSHQPNNLSDKKVILIGRNVSYASALYCGELIRQLQLRKAKEVVIVSAPEITVDDLLDSALRRGMSNIRIGNADDLILD